MATQRHEKVYEKYAWIIFVAIGIEILLPAGINLTAGDIPSILNGLLILGVAILNIAVSVTGFRRGKKWAWYILWITPIFSVAASIGTYLGGYGIMASLGTIIFISIPSVAGLLWPFRIFFPRREVRTASLDA